MNACNVRSKNEGENPSNNKQPRKGFTIDNYKKFAIITIRLPIIILSNSLGLRESSKRRLLRVWSKGWALAFQAKDHGFESLNPLQLKEEERNMNSRTTITNNTVAARSKSTANITVLSNGVIQHVSQLNSKIQFRYPA